MPPRRLHRLADDPWCPTDAVAWSAPQAVADDLQRPIAEVVDPDAARAWIGDALAEASISLGAEAPTRVALVPDDLAGLPPSDEAYRLHLTASGVEIAARRPVGWLRGAATLSDLLRLAVRSTPARRVELPALRIEDWPAIAPRGLLLDVSRNRVPTAQELDRLLERMARCKLDHLQLYTEHTFAYAGHERVWRGWSPITPAEIRRLDARCRRVGIELVPNQNSFGHLHRWLVHEPYRRLAECPEGLRHPFSPDIEPYGLCCEDPGSLELLEDLYDQLLPCFSSRRFHVGCDETLDLGRCRTRAAAEARGRGRLYLDFLHAIDRRVRARGCRSMIWGDMALEHPELVPELPPTTTAMVWGYEPDHRFDADAATFTRAGIDHWLCPGTLAWNSFVGRGPSARRNLTRAVTSALEGGAQGLLICDWGDHGHLQPPPTSWPALAFGAATAWNPDGLAPDDGSGQRAEDVARRRALDRQIFDDPAERIADALEALAQVHAVAPEPTLNGSAFFFALHLAHEPLATRRQGGLDLAAAERALAAIDAAVAPLAEARPSSSVGDALVDEIRWAADGLAFGARAAAARLRHDDAPLHRVPERAALAAEAAALAERLPPLWRSRSRPGGLAASLGVLARWRGLFDPSEPAEE